MGEFLDSRKTYWKCRRGILELDIILERFYKERFQSLTKDEKEIFNRLLDQSDPLLYGWLLGYVIPDNIQFRKIIQKIK